MDMVESGSVTKLGDKPDMRARAVSGKGEKGGGGVCPGLRRWNELRRETRGDAGPSEEVGCTVEGGDKGRESEEAERMARLGRLVAGPNRREECFFHFPIFFLFRFQNQIQTQTKSNSNMV